MTLIGASSDSLLLLCQPCLSHLNIPLWTTLPKPPALAHSPPKQLPRRHTGKRPQSRPATSQSNDLPAASSRQSQTRLLPLQGDYCPGEGGNPTHQHTPNGCSQASQPHTAGVDSTSQHVHRKCSQTSHPAVPGASPPMRTQ